ncbi:hypothetical protein WAI453_011458 [Rhynchosporium graminicola]
MSHQKSEALPFPEDTYSPGSGSSDFAREALFCPVARPSFVPGRPPQPTDCYEMRERRDNGSRETLLILPTL